MLSDIPIIGPMFFSGNIFMYALFVLIGLIHYGLFYTRWGLRVRAVGEHPRAADTVGINVLFTRYRNVILGGIVAGIGGAYFTLGSTGSFVHDMTGGRGFIGLAAMIFGGWTPIGAFLASLDLRLRRRAPGAALDPERRRALGVPADGPVHRHDHRRRRAGRAGPDARGRRHAVREGLTSGARRGRSRILVPCPIRSR